MFVEPVHAILASSLELANKNHTWMTQRCPLQPPGEGIVNQLLVPERPYSLHFVNDVMVGLMWHPEHLFLVR